MEMIDRMFADTLWIWTAIGGSIIGAIALAYLKDTRAGIWFYGKVDQCLDFLVERYGWTWLEQPTDAWRKKYPHVTKKIDETILQINFRIFLYDMKYQIEVNKFFLNIGYLFFDRSRNHPIRFQES